MKKIHENITAENVVVRRRCRSELDLLRSRLKLLTGKDRVLMTMYMENGNSVRQIARLLGVTESKVTRRIRSLTRRLIDGEYIECLRARERFYEHQLRIARDYFLLGMSVEKVAEKRRCSRYQVRKTLHEVQSLVGNL
jgi:predicted DNA-binding protein YlxM (UPF0122 family)